MKTPPPPLPEGYPISPHGIALLHPHYHPPCRAPHIGSVGRSGDRFVFQTPKPPPRIWQNPPHGHGTSRPFRTFVANAQSLSPNRQQTGKAASDPIGRIQELRSGVELASMTCLHSYTENSFSAKAGLDVMRQP